MGEDMGQDMGKDVAGGGGGGDHTELTFCFSLIDFFTCNLMY